eukprot:TRINITY_DN6374_c0_g1_i1.p2 TRINITY_DN6374_c0_g1~~TRINITY_DN6374_c0_g1_i1.p2  ORF type:complete len:401 (+),score=132.00 TRINITY_DN6374_c0_g1_i1:99-1205(+)
MPISAPLGAEFPALPPVPVGARAATRGRRGIGGPGAELRKGTVTARCERTGTVDIAYDDGKTWAGCPERHLLVLRTEGGGEEAENEWDWYLPEGPGRPRVALHRVEPGAWSDRASLDAIFAQIVANFRPHTVRYSNTNPKIAAADAANFDGVVENEYVHGTSEAPTQWKASAYCDLDPEMAGAMQRNITVDKELREICDPLLRYCDERFVAFYERLHGRGAVKDLGRMQSFITRYRPVRGESGLLRHVDGAQVDGSAILALPTPTEFEAGGVTVWERLDGQRDDEGELKEVEYPYPMAPGDMCLLDSCVWHQGNPITAGERWSLVIFYRVTRKKPGSRLGDALRMAARDGILHSAIAASQLRTSEQQR